MTNPVPCLTTATCCKPLEALEKTILENQIAIETWFRKQWQLTPAPITSSVDLRNAAFKLAPVDTNLFPAGFNNLNPDFLPLCIQAAQSIVMESLPGCKKILLVPENHTRNLFYLDSLAIIYDIFSKAGFDIRIGSLDESQTEPFTLTSNNGKELTLYPIRREDNRIVVDDFSPCLILLNNDLSDGIPEKLLNLEQWVKPTEKLGWANRLKSNHFSEYDGVTQEFAELIGIDPWTISPLFTAVDDVDFKNREGEERIAKAVDDLIQKIQDKYLTLDINQPPFVFVKADSGTYGMGVLMVKSGEELLNLNRKQRTKMSNSKGRQKISKVIIQEGVPTYERWGKDNAICEPVVYMIGHHVIGGFYRVHKDKRFDESLNAPGMHFEPLAFVNACHYPNDEHNRFYAYGVIARLAALAAAREVSAIEEKE